MLCYKDLAGDRLTNFRLEKNQYIGKLAVVTKPNPIICLLSILFIFYKITTKSAKMGPLKNQKKMSQCLSAKKWTQDPGQLVFFPRISHFFVF